MLIKLFVVIGVLIGLFIAYVRYLENNSVFYPDAEISLTPKQAGMDYEDVYIDSQSFKIHGWWVPAKHSKGVILFFHGNAGNISGRVSKIEMFHHLNLDVFIIDYRGYGLSQGKSTEQGMYEDALASYDYLMNERMIDPAQVIVYGVSLGGSAGIELAAKRDIRNLIIDSSFSDAFDMAQLIVPFVPRFLLNIQLDNANKVRQLSCEKLFIHSIDDSTVPYVLGRKLYEAAKEPKEFLKTRGSHTNAHLEDEDAFVQGIKKFLQTKGIL